LVAGAVVDGVPGAVVDGVDGAEVAGAGVTAGAGDEAVHEASKPFASSYTFKLPIESTQSVGLRATTSLIRAWHTGAAHILARCSVVGRPDGGIMLKPPDTAWHGNTFCDDAKPASLASSLLGQGAVDAALAAVAAKAARARMANLVYMVLCEAVGDWSTWRQIGE
jgi:hypothetical protein